MIYFVFMGISLAWASAEADLAEASNANAGMSARMAAFERLVDRGNTDISVVAAMSQDEEAEARQRWVAIRVLGQVGGPRSKELLVALLDEEMPAIRAASAQSLGDLGDATVAPMIAGLLQDPAVIVRASAAEALGKLRDPTTVDPLAEALMSKTSYYRGSSLWVRRHYVEALGAIGSRAAIPILLRCLDDADEAVMTAAVAAFADVAGFDFADGRDLAEQRAAWRRWGQAQ